MTATPIHATPDGATPVEAAPAQAPLATRTRLRRTPGSRQACRSSRLRMADLLDKLTPPTFTGAGTVERGVRSFTPLPRESLR
jgi:hypothetical protein